MSDAIIRVENLGKKYIIGHQQKEPYTALRDVIANRVKSLGKKLRHPGRRTDNPNREEFWALNNVSFEIHQGDRVGIIGHNGAGKSTLLKILSRITEPTKGQIRINGRVASLLEVGTGFHPELTGRENIYLNGAILGMSKTEIQRKFDEIVAFAEVEKFLDTPVKRYSSGMYVRLAFAVAAYLEPEILIVDEVLAVGDAKFQKKCLGKMEDVGKQGKTVLFVSHNMATIRQLCSRAILMHQGRLSFTGSTEEAIDRYLNHTQSNTSVSTKVSKHGIELTKVNLYEANTGYVTYSPIFNRDYLLKIELVTKESITNVGLAVLVYNELGILVSAPCTTEEGIDPFVLNGTTEIIFELSKLQLLPGTYRISILVHRSGEQAPDLEAQDILSFEVQAAIVREGMQAYGKKHGIVRISNCASITYL